MFGKQNEIETVIVYSLFVNLLRKQKRTQWCSPPNEMLTAYLDTCCTAPISSPLFYALFIIIIKPIHVI